MKEYLKPLSTVLPAISLAAALVMVGPALTVGAADTPKVPTTSQCVTVGQVFRLVLGPVGSRSGPFFRAFVKDKDCLVVIRYFISRGGRDYVAQVKGLKACRTVVAISSRRFTGGRRFEPALKGATKRSFYSSWKPVRKVDVTVVKGACPR